MNDAWSGRPSDPIKGTASPSTHPQRIRNADVEPHVKRGWSLVLDAARRLVASRRQSMEIDATGGELALGPLEKKRHRCLWPSR